MRSAVKEQKGGILMAHKGLTIARSILLLIAFSATTASLVIMIIQFAMGLRERNGVISFASSKEELPWS